MAIRTQVAIQGVCAWPNLQQLSDGTLIATIWNQPCHGRWEGDLVCYASTDGGESWQYRGTPAVHEPGTNRMNCAVGFAKNADLLVLCSGWDKRRPVGEDSPHEGANPLTPWVSRSGDGGKTWTVSKEFPDQPNGNAYVPFGDIVLGEDGSLRVFAYGRTGSNTSGTSTLKTFVLTSHDDGKTWGEALVLNDKGNETMGIHLGGGRWLAASREEAARDIHLFTSSDDAKSWQREYPLSLPGQHNGHLLKLKDGRIALTFGNRCQHNAGVDIRISDDQGKSWGAPVRLADTESWDCGYPSTIERADGTLVTAWYTQLSGRYHYEMRATFWDTEF